MHERSYIYRSFVAVLLAVALGGSFIAGSPSASAEDVLKSESGSALNLKPGEDKTDKSSQLLSEDGGKPFLALQSTVDNSSVDDLTNRILQKEIEIERLNCHFRMETGLVSRWRQRRLYLYGEANAACTEAGLIEQMAIRYKLKNPVTLPPYAMTLSVSARNNLKRMLTVARLRANKGKLEAGVEEQLIGNFIGLAGDSYEMSLNFLNYFRIRHRGFNPEAYHRRIHILDGQLDALIDQRKQLLLDAASSSSPSDLAVVNAEGKLLKDIHDCELSEYKAFHAGTKNFWVFQNMAFAFDFAKNGTGAAGNIISLLGAHLTKAAPSGRRVIRVRMQGGASLFPIIAGAIVTVTPVVGRVTGNISGLAARRLVSKELVHVDEIDSEQLAADRKRLSELIGSANQQNDIQQNNASSNLGGRTNLVAARLPIYEHEQELVAGMEKNFAAQRKRARKTLEENVAFASIVGPARMSSGILGIFGGWRYWTDPNVANGYYAAGATAYASGTAVNMLETGRLALASELSNRKMARKHTLPRQVIADRLKTLNEMEDLIAKAQAAGAH